MCYLWEKNEEMKPGLISILCYRSGYWGKSVILQICNLTNLHIFLTKRIDIGQDLDATYLLHSRSWCLWSFRTRCRRYLTIGLVIIGTIWYHLKGVWILPLSWEHANYTGYYNFIFPITWVPFSWWLTTRGCFFPVTLWVNIDDSSRKQCPSHYFHAP